ncbi:bifunctional 2-polyprenyl-6-hydroxyphenol methylase/3-demethylubiquinol 3-O-methyltransferase UbiG [Macrococcus sp. DPC7161]|uniref:class I SAM-dependent methyltransferase n=1 Tax=Macrococcus sp. DPC7161 TaxID=2507060 RepID=UPI00100BF282|nr:class I SAM-dependent methyltransferase [Macrococcus sp. DPC7161]RXK17649.1 class I SAM-dependent methyltransferase [Macrococcus sp. DPC7161]
MDSNIFDDTSFFEKYSEMERSKHGLEAAGEWSSFKEMMPSLKGAHVLDLGCGYGWHLEYAATEGAERIVGVDISEKMLKRAAEQPHADQFTLIHSPIEDVEFESHEFDVVMSSLALHYLPSFKDVVEIVRDCLTINGTFIFSVEHPVYTAEGSQDWYYDASGQKAFWPVDDYYSEGERETDFLGEKVRKYHRTLSHYIQVLLDNEFSIKGIDEPIPTQEMLDQHPEMKDELRRPMMLIISARRK